MIYTTKSSEGKTLGGGYVQEGQNGRDSSDSTWCSPSLLLNRPTNTPSLVVTNIGMTG